MIEIDNYKNQIPSKFIIKCKSSNLNKQILLLIILKLIVYIQIIFKSYTFLVEKIKWNYFFKLNELNYVFLIAVYLVVFFKDLNNIAKDVNLNIYLDRAIAYYKKCI